MEAYTGEIRLMAGDYASPDWAPCDGGEYQVSGAQALYSVIKNIYGGTPGRTFRVPNLQTAAGIGVGQGEGLTKSYKLGDIGGGSYKLPDVPKHAHIMFGFNAGGSTADPTNALPANFNLKTKYSNAALASPPITLNINSLENGPKDPTPVDNAQPYLAVSYLICVNGVTV